MTCLNYYVNDFMSQYNRLEEIYLNQFEGKFCSFYILYDIYVYWTISTSCSFYLDTSFYNLEIIFFFLYKYTQNVK